MYTLFISDQFALSKDPFASQFSFSLCNYSKIKASVVKKAIVTAHIILRPHRAK